MSRLDRLWVAIAALLVAVQPCLVAAQGVKQRQSASPKVALPVKPGTTPANGKPKDKAKDVTDPGSSPEPEALPPYVPKLLRLGEILGTLAFLRELCGDGDAHAWRERMSALIDAEGTTVERKEQLAGAFNRGYRGYQFTYRSCTAAARTIIQRLLDEGDRITRDVTSRYAG